MKPVHAYISLTNAGNKIRLILLICFLAQLFFYSVGSLKIPLPARLIEVTINSYLPPKIQLQISQPRIEGFSKFQIADLLVRIDNKILVELEDLSFSLQPSLLLNQAFPLVSTVNFSKATLLPQENNNKNLEIFDLSLDQQSKNNSLFLRSKIKIGHINSSLKFEINDVNLIFNKKWTTEEANQIDFDRIADTIISLNEDILLGTAFIPPIHPNIRGFIDGYGGTIQISQFSKKDAIDEDIKNLISEFTWKKGLENKELLNFQFQAFAEQLNLIHQDLKFNFDSPVIRGGGIFDLKKQKLHSGDSYYTYNSLSTTGRISGEIPKIHIHLQHERTEINAHIFSDVNGTDISLSAAKNEQGWIANGTIRLIPSIHELYAKLPQGKLRIMDGDQIYIRFFSNPTPLKENSATQLLAKAEAFSVLEAPSGDFRFTGEIYSDFSVYINNASGKLGQSEITGSYNQEWNPANYRFLITGQCFPPDINNWLGVWWSPLWQDFSFSDEIPYGDFSINGIWGGPPGNSLTVGQVKTKNFVYRDFSLNSSQIKVEVNSASTHLLCQNVNHQEGSVDCELIFPRSYLEENNIFLSFSFDGDFPANDAKGVLGDDIEEILSDLNASSIYCEAKGQIFKDTQLKSTENNQSWYEIYVSTDSPFNYSGIDLDFAHGEISSLNGIVKGKFDNIGMASGKGRLSFSDTSTRSNQIAISLDLKNADSEKLFQNFSKSSSDSKQQTSILGDDGEVVRKNGGKIDLSIQAEGPNSDPKYFEGTGNFLLHDVDIGSIHFLGGIRSKLGAFNLPLPSDALNFNRLEVPFALEHDRLTFDKATLLGPLSKIEAHGEVNWVSQEVALLADFQLAGNLKIPVLKQILNLADPLSKLSKLKIEGNWDNPDWSIHLGTNPLKQ